MNRWPFKLGPQHRLHMICWVFIGAACASAQPASPSQPPKVLVLNLQADGVDDATVRTLSGILQTELAKSKVIDVQSEAALNAMVELESTRQSIGCDDTSSCLGDIAGALGADRVVFGRVGKLGDTWIVSLGVFDASTSTEMSRQTVQSDRIDALPKKIREAALLLLPYLSDDPVVSHTAPVQAVDERSSSLPWLTIAGGGVLAVGALGVISGGAVAVFAELMLRDTTPPSSQGPTASDKESARARGKVAVLGAVAGTLVGAAGAGLLTFGLME